MLTDKQKTLNADFNAVKGLLGFASFLAGLSWILQSAIYSRNETILGVGKIYTVIAVLMGSGCFFCLVAVGTFNAAGIKNAFCTAFDPDSGFNGLYCGYADGFGAAVAGILLSLAQTALFWFWMPHDPDAYTPGMEKEAALPSGSGGYSGFGGPAPAAASDPEAAGGGAARFEGGFNSSAM